uniref:Major facilitator superfamily (MFS) profile domain-containing protein n=1 Tax=Manihot esculenta TaxID=3983 RepID=A0A2C9V4G6_MANES
MGFFFFSAGFLSLPSIAYHCRTSWRSLYKVISLFPLVYSLVFLPFVSESPRWLLIKGRSKVALEILQRYARLNGKKLPSNLTLANPSVSQVGGEALAETKANDKESLWSTKWAARRMIMVMITSFGVGFVYYGIQLNVENLNFNLYFIVASAFITGASCVLCIVFSRGRRAKSDVSAFSDKRKKLAVSMLRQALIGVLGLRLPETKNAPLYETVKQQEEDEKQNNEV